MKKIIFGALWLLTAAGASAQMNSVMGEAPAQGEPYWGVRLGLDLCSLTGEPYQMAPGWNVGVVYNIPLHVGGVRGLFIEPGAGFYFDRWGIDKKMLALPEEGDYGRGLVKSAYYQTWGLRVPVMVGMAFPTSDALSFSVATGPELSYGFACKQHIDYKLDDTEVNVSEPQYGDYGTFHHADLAWKFALGMNYYRLHLDLAASVGMTKMRRDLPLGESDSHLNRFSVTVGYNF